MSSSPHPAVARRRPQVRRLMLKDFRSYGSLDVAFEGPLIALTGENGAGKTNLIEALSLFSPGRGLCTKGLCRLARLQNTTCESRCSGKRRRQAHKPDRCLQWSGRSGWALAVNTLSLAGRHSAVRDRSGDDRSLVNTLLLLVHSRPSSLSLAPPRSRVRHKAAPRPTAATVCVN